MLPTGLNAASAFFLITVKKEHRDAEGTKDTEEKSDGD
jgi:hypothetical protein